VTQYQYKDWLSNPATALQELLTYVTEHKGTVFSLNLGERILKDIGLDLQDQDDNSRIRILAQYLFDRDDETLFYEFLHCPEDLFYTIYAATVYSDRAFAESAQNAEIWITRTRNKVLVLFKMDWDEGGYWRNRSWYNLENFSIESIIEDFINEAEEYAGCYGEFELGDEEELAAEGYPDYIRYNSYLEGIEAKATQYVKIW
jgi:hypothetical protein